MAPQNASPERPEDRPVAMTVNCGHGDEAADTPRDPDSVGFPPLPPDEIERRTRLRERFRTASEAIEEAVSQLPAEERERLAREWIDEVDEAIRQQAIRLIRQAS